MRIQAQQYCRYPQYNMYKKKLSKRALLLFSNYVNKNKKNEFDIMHKARKKV